VGSVRDTLAVAACLCALGVGAAGCSSTQEKAAAQQAESAQILKERAERQKAKKAAKREHKHEHGKQKGKAK
jgi:uncharacterized protein HemX